MLVMVALEESDSRRELASILISDLYGSSVINGRDVAEGEESLQSHPFRSPIFSSSFFIILLVLYAKSSLFIFLSAFHSFPSSLTPLHSLSFAFSSLLLSSPLSSLPLSSLAHSLSSLGFSMLLDELIELSLDTPDAGELLGNFMARAVADDCIPPAFITNTKDLTKPQAL